jgi:hypothetical protein
MSPFNRPERRALSPEERALLEWLIANGNPDAKQYALQLSDAKVVGLCTCGCPSLDLAIGDREERTTGPSHILADLDGITAEGVQVGIIPMRERGRFLNLRFTQFRTLKALSIFRSSNR